MSEMLCPRDQTKLQLSMGHSYFCDLCGGVLLDVKKANHAAYPAGSMQVK